LFDDAKVWGKPSVNIKKNTKMMILGTEIRNWATEKMCGCAWGLKNMSTQTQTAGKNITSVTNMFNDGLGNFLNSYKETTPISALSYC
jgi:hypothetical protein